MGRSRCGYDSWSLFIDAVLFEPGGDRNGRWVVFYRFSHFSGFLDFYSLTFIWIDVLQRMQLRNCVLGNSGRRKRKKKEAAFSAFFASCMDFSQIVLRIKGGRK